MTRQETTAVLPEANRDLLEGAHVAHLATVRSDGNLQSNPVWFDWDGTYAKISQTKARQKFRNLTDDPHVALSITDPGNPYRYLEVRGVVDKIEDDVDYAFVDDLSARYLGQRRPASTMSHTARVNASISTRSTSASPTSRAATLVPPDNPPEHSEACR